MELGNKSYAGPRLMHPRWADAADIRHPDVLQPLSFLGIPSCISEFANRKLAARQQKYCNKLSGHDAARRNSVDGLTRKAQLHHHHHNIDLLQVNLAVILPQFTSKWHPIKNHCPRYVLQVSPRRESGRNLSSPFRP
eukprot:scaffold23644_cov183-Amphora_coffeaeformis.AAC.1